jgi:hypothetical protein
MASLLYANIKDIRAIYTQHTEVTLDHYNYLVSSMAPRPRKPRITLMILKVLRAGDKEVDFAKRANRRLDHDTKTGQQVLKILASWSFLSDPQT